MDHNTYCNTYYYSQYEFDEYEKENQSYDYESENDFDEKENQNEKDGDALLISLVRDHPYLYNKGLTDFKDSVKKQNAWMEISNVFGITADECQTRWIRLRERYSREKKLKLGETTTGSGASKRKSFEFFEDMNFLEPFIKKRRTLTNVSLKNVSPLTKCSNFQKNFGSRGGKQTNMSPAIMSTLNRPSPRDSNVDSEQNLFKTSSNDDKQINAFPATTSTFNRQSSRDSNVDSEQNFLKISSNDGKEINASSAINIKQSLTSDTDVHLKDLRTSDIDNLSDTSSASTLNASHNMKKKNLGQRNKSKEKSQSNVTESAICKVTSIMENKYSSPTSSSLIKPEIEEDTVFCQLILALLTKMSKDKNAEKKKEILRILYDI